MPSYLWGYVSSVTIKTWHAHCDQLCCKPSLEICQSVCKHPSVLKTMAFVLWARWGYSACTVAGKVSMREAVSAAVVDSETKQFEITMKT